MPRRGTCGAPTVYGARTEGTAGVTVLDRQSKRPRRYAQPADQVASQLGVDPQQGLSAEEVARRLTENGPNEIPAEPPPSRWVVARGQLANPMNIMLLIVGVASFFIGQVATGLVGHCPGHLQRLDGDEPGVEGAGQRGCSGAAPGASGAGSPVGSGRTDRIKTARAGRCGASRGRAATVVLVLDDLQLADEDEAVAGHLAQFALHLPSRLHVVLSSRREPKLPLARLRCPGPAQ